jgi:hypothetical protein
MFFTIPDSVLEMPDHQKSSYSSFPFLWASTLLGNPGSGSASKVKGQKG